MWHFSLLELFHGNNLHFIFHLCSENSQRVFHILPVSFVSVTRRHQMRIERKLSKNCSLTNIVSCSDYINTSQLFLYRLSITVRIYTKPSSRAQVITTTKNRSNTMTTHLFTDHSNIIQLVYYHMGCSFLSPVVNLSTTIQIVILEKKPYLSLRRFICFLNKTHI